MGEWKINDSYENVENIRQLRSRYFPVLMYEEYALLIITAAALLDEIFGTFPLTDGICLLWRLYGF